MATEAVADDRTRIARGPLDPAAHAVSDLVSSSSDRLTRVVVVDDDELVRSALRLTIESCPGIELVGEADNGVDAVDVVRRLLPDVVLMDVRMPQLNGVDATRRIVRLDLPTRVLILTAAGKDEDVVAAMEAGARWFVPKTASPDELTAAIAAVASGESLHTVP